MFKQSAQNIHVLFDLCLIPDGQVATSLQPILQMLQNMKLLESVASAAAASGTTQGSSSQDPALKQAQSALDKWFGKLNNLVRSSDVVRLDWLTCNCK